MAFTDDFNRSDEFLEADAAWTKLSGAQGSAVDTNQLRVKYASSEGAFTHTDQGSSAHYTQADYISTNNAASFAICTRLTNANNFIGVRYNGSAAQMYKRNSGSFTLLGSYTYSKTGTETWKLESDSSDNHVLYISGTSRIAPSSDSFNNTETAQGFVARSGNDVLLDNWSADTVTASGVSGTLDATETATDTASLTAEILLSGSLSATETGSDTASLTGKVFLSASLSATETDSDTAALTGQVKITGSVVVTETSVDTAAFLSGTPAAITGTLSATETGVDTGALTGQIKITSNLSATEVGTDTASLSGTIAISGSFAATETDNDTAAFYQTQVFSGTLNAVETGEDVALFGVFKPLDDQQLSIAVELSITESIYNVLGQSIIYKGASAVHHILAIVDNQDELFPPGFESQASNGDVKARVQKADIASPTRGDLIADKSGKTYYISSYTTLNEAEWELELRRQNG